MNTPQNRPNFKSVGEGDFESAVLQSTKPVLVVFCAPWSKPCKVIDTALVEVAKTCAGHVEILKVDADDNPHLSLWYGVQSIPTLLCFVAGSLREKVVGTASKEAILTVLRRHCHIGSGQPLPRKN
jgi:thioredoxin 1